MKYILMLFCFLLIWSCKTDKEDIDCALFDPAISSLFIKLVDTEGNNLIENETYIADDIVIRYNDSEFKNVVFKNVESLNNLIALNLIGVTGDNQFEIELSGEETDALVLNLTIESKICGYTFYKFNSATYNSILKTIEDFNGNYLITVIK